MRRPLKRIIFTPLLCGLMSVSFAQSYPVKPIRLIVGFSAGGSADTSARMFAKRMGELMKTTFVVENRGGAGGSYATQIAADSNADGYTLLWGNVGPLTVNPALGMKLGYDVDRDFAPVGLTMTFANALIARSDFPANSLAGVMALAKEKPGQLNYAMQGVANYDATFWYALLTQANVPAAVIARLNREMLTVLSEPDIVSALEAQGLIAAPSSPQNLREIMRADFAKWKRVLASNR